MTLETLYLLRHAHAEETVVGTSRYADDRPLSGEGKTKMAQTAPNMAKVIERLDLIISSPLSRARETAEIVHEAIDISPKIVIAEKLQPGATPEEYRRVMVEHAAQIRSIMIVAHEPDLGAFLASVLRASPAAFPFKKGMLARVDMNDYAAVLRFFIPNFVFRAMR